MENKQTDQGKAGTMTTQKTNEDFNKKQPDLKDPNEKKAETDPEVPNLDVPKKGNPDDVRMNNDAGKENEVKKPEIIDEDATEDVEDNGPDDDGKNSDSDRKEKVRTNEVTM